MGISLGWLVWFDRLLFTNQKEPPIMEFENNLAVQSFSFDLLQYFCNLVHRGPRSVDNTL